MVYTVVQKRKSLEKSLARSLGSDFITVTSPDHPLVLRSTDILIGGRAGLTAIMFATEAEKRQSRYFRSRLVLNKLALPQETRFIFVSAPGDEFLISGVTNEFSAILSFDDQSLRSELTGLAEQPGRLSKKSIPDKLLAQTQARFGETYRLARALQRRMDRNRVSEPRQLAERIAMHAAFLSNKIHTTHFSSPPNPGRINSLALDGADRWFAEDNGIFPQDVPASAAFASAYPVAPGDPDKYMRAAAFAGWILAPGSALETNENLAEVISRRTRLI
ncbi:MULTISPECIES: hypothetical protein [unclassified Rhizobium]|uniref:hypothetical protein n=1 Tax=unclassified Rhizobium TaxID=2613769 RepID=UPI0007E95B4C|nr:MULTISPECIES: hypothetical protein [unclassified Rhizobium]ANK87409.1 hypothetical protein AMK02_CH03887 [Rhizobium sp. N731]ANL17655.1 hypothetical protein AMJ97_CH03885 [Rhizobium sp. N1314]